MIYISIINIFSGFALLATINYEPIETKAGMPAKYFPVE